jgi:hypothetical protein
VGDEIAKGDKERGMKRFLIFLLLGPLLGFLVFLLRDAAAGEIFGGFMGIIFGLPFAYLFGLPIVIIMWFEDWLLSDKITLGTKIATSACVGYLGSILMLLATSARHIEIPQILSFGLVGAIPAVTCSWLAGRAQRHV